MKCIRLRKHLLPYAEGVLPERLLKRLEEHLAACDSCTRELDEIARTVSVLRQTDYPQMEPAFDLRSRVMARIPREPVRRSRWAGKLPAYSAAAAALLVFAIIIVAVEPVFFPNEQAARSPELAMKETMPREKAMDLEARPEPPSKGAGFQLGAPMTHGGPQAVRPTATSAPGMKLPAAKPSERMAEALAPPVPKGQDFAHSDSAAGRLRVGEKVAETWALKRGEATDTVTGGYEMGKSLGVESLTAAPATPPPPAGPSLAGAVPEGHPRDVAQAYFGGTQQAPQPAAELPGRAEDLAMGMGNVSPGREARVPLEPEKAAGERIVVLEKRLREFPNSRTVLGDLVHAYREAGRAEDEYAVAQRLTKLDPENAKYWLALAQAAEKAKMPRTAAAAYRRVVELKPAAADLELANSRLKALEAADK